MIIDADGMASATVSPTGSLGPAKFTAAWDGLRAAANAKGNVTLIGRLYLPVMLRGAS